MASSTAYEMQTGIGEIPKDLQEVYKYLDEAGNELKKLIPVNKSHTRRIKSFVDASIELIETYNSFDGGREDYIDPQYPPQAPIGEYAIEPDTKSIPPRKRAIFKLNSLSARIKLAGSGMINLPTRKESEEFIDDATELMKEYIKSCLPSDLQA